jgi:parvulin-like peptidyl-prolyl isomerase
VGEISHVVESEVGLHLILARERKPGAPIAFEKCINLVRETFMDDFRIELAKKLRKQAQVKISLPEVPSR